MLRPKKSSAKTLFESNSLRVPLNGHRPDLPLICLAGSALNGDGVVKVDNREAIRCQSIPGASNMFPHHQSPETFVIFGGPGRTEVGRLQAFVARVSTLRQ